MDLSCIPEYPSVPAGESRRLHFILRIETKPAENGPPGLTRKPVNIALVIDRSGSMTGEKMAYTKQAALRLVDRLTASDVLSVVSYADGVRVHLPPTRVADKEGVRAAIQGIEPRGSTNLSGGWLKALSLLKEYSGDEFVSRVILLTDGEANEGVTSEEDLARIAGQHRERGLPTTAIGFGAEFNEDLLMDLADEGGGRFYFVQQAEDAPGIFLEEFGELSRVYGQNLEVCFEAAEGVGTAEVLAAVPQEEGARSVTVRYGDLLESDVKETLFALRLPPGLEPGTARLATVTVRYDAVRGETGAQARVVQATVELTPPGAGLPERNQEVARRLALHEIARQKREASRRLRSGDRAGATLILEKASTLTQTSLHLDPDTFNRENQSLTLIMDSLKIKEHLAEAQKALAAEAHDFHMGRRGHALETVGGRRRFSLRPGEPDKVAELLGTVRAALRADGHDDDLLARAEYVCGELVSNALEHGCRGRDDPRVEVALEVNGSRFRCTVEDNGPGFQYKKVLKREERLAEGGADAGSCPPGGRPGRGLLTVRREADGLRFSGRGNKVTVTLKRKRFRVRTKRIPLRAAAGEMLVGIAAVEGGVDSRSYGMLEERLDELVGDRRDGSRRIEALVADLSGCGYVSSTGIGVLVKAQRALADTSPESSGRVVIVGMKPQIRRLFEKAGFSAPFEFAETLDEAKKLLSGS